MTPQDFAPGEPGWRVDWRDEVGSTNDELAVFAAAGAPVGTVIATDNQTAGHGRLGRQWVSPRGTGLAMSALVGAPFTPPDALPERSGLVPLLAGMSVVDALADFGLHSQVKWPNDVLVDDRKVAGVLCRAADARVIVGVGVNTDVAEADLPVPTAGSLSMFDVKVSPRELLDVLLRNLGRRMTQWRERGDDVLLADYRGMCSTIGREVRVHLATHEFTGHAVGVDGDGALVLVHEGEAITVSAGDVVHLRMAD